MTRDASVLGDVVARDRRSDRPALRAPGDPDRAYDYRRLATTAWKTGNHLRYLGVRAGSRVGVPAARHPEPVLVLLGAALVGAVVRLDPPRSFDGRAVVAPTDRVRRFDLPPGSRRVGYGAASDDPSVVHFERDVWRENPTEPPESVAPDDPVVATAATERTHADLLAAAAGVAADLRTDDVVAVREPLGDPDVLAAGLVAPLLAGAAVLFPDGEAVGTVAVTRGRAPEDRVRRPGT
ncbi:MAG: AMP-binding protein [Halobacteriaceae archaeon]